RAPQLRTLDAGRTMDAVPHRSRDLERGVRVVAVELLSNRPERSRGVSVELFADALRERPPALSANLAAALAAAPRDHFRVDQASVHGAQPVLGNEAAAGLAALVQGPAGCALARLGVFRVCLCCAPGCDEAPEDLH